MLRDDQKYTAVNAAGFEIDVIRRAVEVPSGQALLDGGRFSQVVVATNGAMATMHAPLPASFVRIKTSLSQRHDRDPLKRRKDQLQAKVVEQLLTDHGLDHVVRSKGG